MLNKLAEFSRTRLAWGLLFFSAFVLEAIALYFQYGMGLEPCIMCIYQRTATLGIVAAGLIGLASPASLPVRLIALSCWGVSAIWGWLLAKEHISMQTTTDPFAFTCDFVPNFPSFMPLHEWLPAFFAATGDCGNIDWFFAGLSMPGWMEVIFALYSLSFIAFAAVFIAKR